MGKRHAELHYVNSEASTVAFSRQKAQLSDVDGGGGVTDSHTQKLSHLQAEIRTYANDSADAGGQWKHYPGLVCLSVMIWILDSLEHHSGVSCTMEQGHVKFKAPCTDGAVWITRMLQDNVKVNKLIMFSITVIKLVIYSSFHLGLRWVLVAVLQYNSPWHQSCQFALEIFVLLVVNCMHHLCTFRFYVYL